MRDKGSRRKHGEIVVKSRDAVEGDARRPADKAVRGRKVRHLNACFGGAYPTVQVFDSSTDV